MGLVLTAPRCYNSDSVQQLGVKALVRNTIPGQVWFVVAMLVALVGLGLGIALGGAGRAATGRPASIDWRATQRRPPTPVEAGAASQPTVVEAGVNGTLTATLTPTPLAAQAAMRPTRAPYIGLTERSDHYWMMRPLDDEHNDAVARFYPYGSRQDGSYPIHHGVEFVNPLGTPVRAVADGEIVVAGGDQIDVLGARDGFYGLVVVLKLDRAMDGMPVYALYGHLSEPRVAVGQRVSAGQVIGLVGETGAAEAPHLHFEVRVGANDYQHTVNPELWLEPRPGYGTLAGVLLSNAGTIVDDEARLIIRSASGAARYETHTYPAVGVNPDPGWLENFGVGDLAAGNWTVQTFHRGQLLEATVNIVAGETTWLEIRLVR